MKVEELLSLYVYQSTVRSLNPIALRKAKIVCNFGLSECNRVNFIFLKSSGVSFKFK